MESQQRTKTGIVLMNTGTPASPDPRDIKPYLAEFLADPHLISMPRFVWLPILHLFVVNARPQATAKRYEAIWTDEGSPFMLTSLRQAQRTQEALAREGLDIPVRFAARYGQPSLESVVTELQAEGCTNILVIPLYPQTAYSTTATCRDKVLATTKLFPRITFNVVEGYADHPGYAKAIAQSIKDNWNYQPGSKLLLSFHSIPLRDVRSGDTYAEQARKNVEIIMDRLGIPEEDWEISFHSRFEDSRRWLGPSPKKVLSRWADEGITRVAMVTPGFSTDCLETLLDCAVEQRDHFLDRVAKQGATGEFTYIPALNDRDDHIDLIASLIKENL